MSPMTERIPTGHYTHVWVPFRDRQLQNPLSIVLNVNTVNDFITIVGEGLTFGRELDGDSNAAGMDPREDVTGIYSHEVSQMVAAAVSHHFNVPWNRGWRRGVERGSGEYQQSILGHNIQTVTNSKPCGPMRIRYFHPRHWRFVLVYAFIDTIELARSEFILYGWKFGHDALALPGTREVVRRRDDRWHNARFDEVQGVTGMTNMVWGPL